MDITYLAAGAGAMYCGACARDINVIRALIAQGHAVQVLPVYTPLRIEGEPVPTTGVFLGGINAYLQQVSGLFRRTPRFIERLLDHPALLRFASSFAVRTSPKDLGAMTVSVLQGRDGRQAKELHKLIGYLEHGRRSDAIIITNSLLSGIAPELRRHLDIPILCGLQGEDQFVRSMPERYCNQARELMARNAEAIDLFIAPTAGYATEMAAFMTLDPRRIRVVRTGFPADDYRHEGLRVREPFTIGYLSVITPIKGLDLLVRAFRTLVVEQGRDCRLRVAGRIMHGPYWQQQKRSLRAAGLTERFEYLGEVDFAGKLRLLRSCSVFSVPSRFAEARGLAMMEAIASGVPVAAPDSGLFPELLGITGGGLLFPQGDADALAERIASLMDAPDRADEMGRTGAERIGAEFNSDRAAEEMLAVLGEVVTPASG